MMNTYSNREVVTTLVSPTIALIIGLAVAIGPLFRVVV